MAEDNKTGRFFPVWDYLESWLSMGHGVCDFWRCGMLDFKRASNAYMRSNGIEKPREILPDEYDYKYKKAAAKLKKSALARFKK